MRVDSQQERDSHNACVCVFLSVSFSLLCCDSWPVASETAIGVVGTHFPSVLLLGLCLGIFPQNLVKYLNFSCCVGYPWNCLRVLGWLSWLLLFVFWFESGFGSLAIHDFDRRDISVEWFDSVSLSGVVGIRHEKERVYRFVTSIMDEILRSDGLPPLTWNVAALWFWIWRCWWLFHVEFSIPYGL